MKSDHISQASYTTHRDADVERCVNFLADLFPGFAESTDQEIREWKAEFGMRPAELCLAAIRRYHRGNASGSIYPRLGVFLTHLNAELKARAPDPAQVSRQQMAAYRGRTSDLASLTDWAGSLPSDERDRLHQAAAEKLSGGRPDIRLNWLRRVPSESKALAAMMRALVATQGVHRP